MKVYGLHNNKQRNVVCGIIYRHPSGNIEDFLDYLQNAIESIYNSNKCCIIPGDFNLSLLNFESHPQTEKFLNSLSTYFFLPQILKPTRIAHHSATLIDNIFLNSAEHISLSRNILYDISDHLPNFLIINKFSSLPSHMKFLKRDYSKFNQQLFVNDISSVDWTTILPQRTGVDDIFEAFYSEPNRIVNVHAPLRKLSNREVKLNAKPWITKGIRMSIRKKNKFYEKFIKTRQKYYESMYKSYRNKLSNLIKASKKKYYTDYFHTNTKNIKNI